jgi:hypothetical protein
MVALWSEDGYTLRMSAAVPDLGAVEERLDWLTKVDARTWLDAMPEKVVKTADHEAAVREMLKGIPVPAAFKPSRVPDEGLTTNRYQVGAAVTGTVSCLWLRQWGQARRSGDRAAAAEAEQALADPARDGKGRRLSQPGLGTRGGHAERLLGTGWTQTSAAAPRGRPRLRPLGNPGAAVKSEVARTKEFFYRRSRNSESSSPEGDNLGSMRGKQHPGVP